MINSQNSSEATLIKVWLNCQMWMNIVKKIISQNQVEWICYCWLWSKVILTLSIEPFILRTANQNWYFIPKVSFCYQFKVLFKFFFIRRWVIKFARKLTIRTGSDNRLDTYQYNPYTCRHDICANWKWEI